MAENQKGARNELVDHIHYIVWGFKEKQITPEGARYIDYVEMDVIALAPQLALERAEKLLPKSFLGGDASSSGYRIMRVFEHIEGQCYKGH